MSERKYRGAKRGPKPKFGTADMDVINFRVPRSVKKDFKVLCVLQNADMSNLLRAFVERSLGRKITHF